MLLRSALNLTAATRKSRDLAGLWGTERKSKGNCFTCELYQQLPCCVKRGEAHIIFQNRGVKLKSTEGVT